jgi:hypothetical protein
MRHAWILACALALGGCNFVFSEKPMFTLAEARGGAPLRPGVWMKPEAGCEFDKTQPVKAWPSCAGGVVVYADKLVDPAKPDKDMAYILAAGDPRVFQTPLTDDSKKTIYLYGGIRPAAHDERGRVTAFTSWIAQCGPPPPKPKPDDPHPRYLTEHPLPGLKVIEKDGMCEAVEPGPVRAAVRASEAWSEDIRPASWVRDGEE